MPIRYCFLDCSGAVSVSEITNGTVPLFRVFFFFRPSTRHRSLQFIMQAAWRYLTECAICSPQLQSPSHYHRIAGSLTPLLPATVKQRGNDGDAAVWGGSERKDRRTDRPTPEHLCKCWCNDITKCFASQSMQLLPFKVRLLAVKFISFSIKDQQCKLNEKAFF